jgi:MoxR-like ATPase
MQNVSGVLKHGRSELGKVIVGQEELINQCLLAILCGGHALLEGVPGIDAYSAPLTSCPPTLLAATS